MGTDAAVASSELKVLRRSDYTPVPYTAKTVDLDVSIHDGHTNVTGNFALVPNPKAAPAPAGTVAPLVLYRGAGAIQEIVAIKINGAPVPYAADDKHVTLTPPADAAAAGFKLTVEAKIKPEANTMLEGLYKSNTIYVTQCEAEGFRNIVPFLDRPDVMAVYTVRVEADEGTCPVLLSNGDLVESGKVAGSPGRHWARFHDRWPKPSYLFALVAGQLAVRTDSFTTMKGEAVKLSVYSEERDVPKTAWAMESLKRSMKWDEDRFGLAYDCGEMRIVVSAHFNMGAMENKSLNIFNSRLVLCSPETATDVDYNRVEGVVAHEYFHNYTGNRVTCRDWFQLTLKEGLTVYRDQEFTADVNSRPVKRIEDVLRLRVSQFTEDAGPTAHPIRPDEIMKYENLYSATVYEKGAEVIRLYATTLGVDGFRRGMDLYFARHDGQAVTCEEFYQAMYDANPGHPGLGDMPALLRWYGQAGTPAVTVTPSYDADARTLTLAASQSTPPSAGQPVKQPVLVPIAVGLVGPDGADLPLALEGASLPPGTTTTVLRLTQAAQSWTFTGVPAGSVPSILRGFSAPVRLTVGGQTDAQLAFLFAHDSDPCNRWEAGQTLGRRILTGLYETGLAAVTAAGAEAAGDVDAAVGKALAAGGAGAAALAPLVTAFAALLGDAALDGSFVARAISLPSETELVDGLAARANTGGWAHPLVVHAVRDWAVASLAGSLRSQLGATVARLDAAIASAEAASGGYSPDFASVARRALRNKALAYLGASGDAAALADVAARHAAATNMTDSLATLAILAEGAPPGSPTRDGALAAFAARWKDEPLVLLKWLSLQAMSGHPGTTEAVRGLMSHPAYSPTNPNANYSLLGAYASSPAFHAADGSGYAFLAGCVAKLDGINPTVAARIVAAFARYRSYDPARQALMRAQLAGLAAAAGGKLSENVGEIVARSLAA